MVSTFAQESTLLFFSVCQGPFCRSIFGTIGGSLQTLVGGNITLFTNLCEKTREDAFEMLLDHASERGANAVIGVRYDATELLQGVTEVLCYGTAVFVEKNP